MADKSDLTELLEDLAQELEDENALDPERDLSWENCDPAELNLEDD